MKGLWSLFTPAGGAQQQQHQTHSNLFLLLLFHVFVVSLPVPHAAPLTHGLLEDAAPQHAGPWTRINDDILCARWAVHRGRITLQNPWRVAVCFCNISQEVKSDPTRRPVRKQSLRFFVVSLLGKQLYCSVCQQVQKGSFTRLDLSL